MRVKLFVVSLLPISAIAGWTMFGCARWLGQPLLEAPRDVSFVLLMALIGGGSMGVLTLVAALLFDVKFEQRDGKLVLVPRSRSETGVPGRKADG